MKKILSLVTLALVAVSLCACANTLSGAGRDISKAGEKIQETF